MKRARLHAGVYRSSRLRRPVHEGLCYACSPASRSLQGLPGTTHSLGCPVATTAITGCALAIQPSSRRCVAIGPSGELIVLADTIAGKPSPNQRLSSKGMWSSTQAAHSCRAHTVCLAAKALLPPRPRSRKNPEGASAKCRPGGWCSTGQRIPARRPDIEKRKKHSLVGYPIPYKSSLAR
jgi:hypothetical protein